MPLVDIARALHPLDDRTRARVGVVDDWCSFCHGSAVWQHTGAVKAKRIAVLPLGLLGRFIEVLSKRSFIKIHGRNVEDIEPEHWLLRSITVIMRRPVRGNDEIARRHEGLFTFYRRIGALPVEYEA